ncbi:4Fe-4S dicluster domain-containing protein [bacterium]|nr:4Fe-4S dicluster domain-containing protein [bacterium]
MGLLVESHEGRPTKVEGNPAHPFSLGAASALNQASVLELYDPDRMKKLKANSPGVVAPAAEYESWLNARLSAAAAAGGDGTAILIERSASPTVHRLIDAFTTAYPQSRIYQYDPINPDNQISGIRTATGKYIRPVVDFEKADRIVAIDSDFLGHEVGGVANAKAFSNRRDPDHQHGLNRLYSLESHFTLTGGKADHRIRLRPSQYEGAVAQIASAVFEKTGAKPGVQSAVDRVKKQIIPADILAAIVEDLTASGLRSVVVAGIKQTPFVHALVYAINAAIGANSRVLSYYPVNFSDRHYVVQPGIDALKELTAAINKGNVKTLFIIGGNPAFTAPSDIRIADAIKKTESVHLTLYENETSRLAKWVLPRAHYLESWGDAKAVDNTVSLVQPLISPLHKGISDIEFLATLVSGQLGSGYDEVRATYSTGGTFVSEKSWRRWLHEGVVSNGKPVDAPVASDLPAPSFKNAKSGIDLAFYQDHKIYDGRFSNNGWLQELPDPITKLTWDNAALISPELGKKLGVSMGETACQAENNIPIVGKSQVANGREMHWIRLDRYYEGPAEDPTLVQQPMTCLQCENAPCEQVCPVAATVHTEEGLNDMVYNRCIGTKYCSNNCPVKVRRFNFFDFQQRNPQSVAKNRTHFFDYMREPDKTVQMQFNPNVSIRMRGVMEKCTYCVQRIQEARIVSRNEGREIRDGEVKTACMQTCPSNAIVFGNILDPESKVAQLKKSPRDYHILKDLHLKARTSFLATIRNPHPKLAQEERA